MAPQALYREAGDLRATRSVIHSSNDRSAVWSEVHDSRLHLPAAHCHRVRYLGDDCVLSCFLEAAGAITTLPQFRDGGPQLHASCTLRMRRTSGRRPT